MQFKVPQFIEHETKIFGPLTFKQFILVAIAGGISFVLYFSMQENLFLWIFVSALLVGFALSMSFIQIEGSPLFVVIGKSIGYFLNPKRYIWKKKPLAPKFTAQRKPEKEKGDRGPERSPLRTAEKSRLKQVKSDIEMR